MMNYSRQFCPIKLNSNILMDCAKDCALQKPQPLFTHCYFKCLCAYKEIVTCRVQDPALNLKFKVLFRKRDFLMEKFFKILRDNVLRGIPSFTLI